MSYQYPQILDLDQLSVHREDGEKYFLIEGLPGYLTYGKHYFSIGYDDPQNETQLLKQSSKVLFEFKDEAGTTIFSDLTEYSNINGA